MRCRCGRIVSFALHKNEEWFKCRQCGYRFFVSITDSTRTKRDDTLI